MTRIKDAHTSAVYVEKNSVREEDLISTKNVIYVRIIYKLILIYISPFQYFLSISVLHFFQIPADSDPNKNTFGCDVCGKFFVDRSLLKKHKVTHLG